MPWPIHSAPMTMSPVPEQEQAPEPPRGPRSHGVPGPVAPHWEVESEFGDRSLIEEFRQRALARLVLLPPHDPQFRRNRERIVRDAERENVMLEWDLGVPEEELEPVRGSSTGESVAEADPRSAVLRRSSRRASHSPGASTSAGVGSGGVGPHLCELQLAGSIEHAGDEASRRGRSWAWSSAEAEELSRPLSRRRPG